MELCERNHRAIVHEETICPSCALASIQENYRWLLKRNEDLRDEIERLGTSASERRQKDAQLNPNQYPWRPGPIGKLGSDF